MVEGLYYGSSSCIDVFFSFFGRLVSQCICERFSGWVQLYCQVT